VPTNEPPRIGSDDKVIPAEAHGIKVISMGMLTGDDKPAILRGPMVAKYLRMFITEVAWGGVDVLLLDLPPGTGDVQLTLAQAFPLSGAVIVTTPQDVSLKIARRGLRMMEQVKVPILGIVENMSGFTCPSCGTVTHIFHHGGGERIAGELGVPFLGAVPLDPAVVDCGDAGRPLVVAHPEAPAAAAYRTIAAEISGSDTGGKRLQLPFDWDWVENRGKPEGHPEAAAPGATAEVPLAMERPDARTLEILWADGAASRFDMRDLRLACRCAQCVDEMSGKPLLDPASVPLDVTARRIWSLGNYAIGIAFSDGHQSGIYPFTTLRAMQAAEAEDV
jgi:ATP-binding protein involved in chromosome partitioning